MRGYGRRRNPARPMTAYETIFDGYGRRMRVRDTLLILLTVASGAVDAVCFLGIGQVFTAIVTGNLVLLGVGAGTGDWVALARSGVAVAAYATGVLLSARVVPRATGTDPWPRRTAFAVYGEAVLQLGVAVAWLLLGGAPPAAARYTMIVAYGISMGAQSTVAQALAVHGISTTYVTGTLLSLLTDLLTGRRGGRRRRALVVAAVVAGAVATAVLLRVAQPVAPFLPAALTLGTAITATVAFRHAHRRRVA